MLEQEIDTDTDIIFEDTVNIHAPSKTLAISPGQPAATHPEEGHAATILHAPLGAQGSLLSLVQPQGKANTSAPVHTARVYRIPTTRCERSRVLALLSFFDPEEVARKLGLPDSFQLTRWVRGEIRKKGSSLTAFDDIHNKINSVELHFLQYSGKLA